MNKETELANLKRKQKLLSKDKYPDSSKNRLKKIVRTKITTTFINAISEFEKTFGIMWGYGIEENKLTNEQKENRKKWETVRKNILNRGNNQARALMSEIELYDIEFRGYEMTFKRRDIDE